MPAVSVIIPTYKHRDFVRQTLDSVFAQTFADYEVIVLNDGSPDDTAAVLRPLVEAGRIRYAEHANVGQSETRNRGIAMATGEFVALLDDDDLWPPDKLAWQVEVLRTTDAVAVGGLPQTLKDGTLEAVHESDRVTTLTTLGLYTGPSFYSPGQVLIRADALRAVGGFDSAIWGCDDLDLWLRLAHHGPVRLHDRVALIYRVHAGNASAAWERMLVNHRKATAKNLSLLPPEHRCRAARAAELGAYTYAAAPRLHAVWSWRPKRWAEAVRAVSYFARSVPRQPRIGLMIAKDFVPRPLIRAAKAVLRRH